MKCQPKLYLHGGSDSTISIKIKLIAHIKPENATSDTFIGGLVFPKSENKTSNKKSKRN